MIDLLNLIPVFLAIVCFELGEHAKDNKFPLSLGKWWNTSTSWKNKHEWQPSWLFKTALVFITDAEHFFQWLAHIFIITAFIPYVGFSWMLLAIALTIFGASFLMNELVLKNGK